MQTREVIHGGLTYTVQVAGEKAEDPENKAESPENKAVTPANKAGRPRRKKADDEVSGDSSA